MSKIILGLVIICPWVNSSLEHKGLNSEFSNPDDKNKQLKLKTSNGSELKLKFIFDGDDTTPPFYYKANLYFKNKLSMEDNESYEYQFNDSSIMLLEYKTTIYIFCRYNDRPDPDKWRIFCLKNSDYQKAINLDADIGIDFMDIDDDGMIEFGGFPQSYEAYCFKCDSAYYMSNLIYQIGDSVMLDSAASINANMKRYGKHIDFTRGNHIVKIK